MAERYVLNVWAEAYTGDNKQEILDFVTDESGETITTISDVDGLWIFGSPGFGWEVPLGYYVESTRPGGVSSVKIWSPAQWAYRTSPTT